MWKTLKRISTNNDKIKVSERTLSYFQFLDLNQEYWATKEYEIVNLSSVLKWKKIVKNEHYVELVEKTAQNSFRNLFSVVDLLRDYKIILELGVETTKKEIYSQLKKLPQKLELKTIDDTLEIDKNDLYLVIQNAKLLDLIDGDLVIVPSNYYNNYALQRNANKIKPVSKRKEFRKIRVVISLICIAIIAILVVLTIFSGDITALLKDLQTWFNQRTNQSGTNNYAYLLIGFIEFIIKLLVVYIIYRLLLLVIAISFQVMRKNTIKKELAKILKSDITLKERVEEYSTIVSNVNKKTQSAVKGLRVFLKIILCIFCIIIVLSLFNLSFSSLLTSAGVLTLAVSIAAQSLIADYFAGIMYAFEDHYNLGDLVEINGVQGRIIEVTLRRICIETYSKELHFILHSQIKQVINYSKDNNKAKVSFDIAYESDPQKVIDLLKKRLGKMWHANSKIVESPDIYALSDFHDSGIGFYIMAECEKETRWSVERWLRMKVFYILLEAGVEIPYQKIVISTDSNNNQIQIEDSLIASN